MDFVPKFITDKIGNFKIVNAASWLGEIIIYLSNPRKFRKLYQSRELEIQISQIIFLCALDALITFTLGAGDSYKPVYRLIFLIFITTIPFIVINILSFSIVSKSMFKFWDIISYIIIGNLIFFFPAIIFLHLFIENENYVFQLLANICIAIAVIYYLFIIWIAFTSSIKKILLGCFINILLNE